MRRLDGGAALDVHTVNNYVIRILRERLRKERSALRIPSSLHLLNALAQRCFIRGASVLQVHGLNRKAEHQQSHKYQCFHFSFSLHFWKRRMETKAANPAEKSSSLI